VANKSKDCRKKWIDTEGYEEQNPPEAGPIQMAPGDTYCVAIEVRYCLFKILFYGYILNLRDIFFRARLFKTEEMFNNKH
jgi:hypothetical protein